MKDYKIEELVKYRESHSVKETADYYETTPNYINKLYYKYKGLKRDDKYFDFCKDHYVNEIIDKYCISEHRAKQDKTIALKRSINPEELYKYYSTHTFDQTKKKFGIGQSSIYEILASNGYEPVRHKNYDNFDIETFKEYCKNHTQNQVAKHFNLSFGRTKWLMEKYSCNYRKKCVCVYYQSGKNVYILSKDGDELIFPRIIDIAKYFNRTSVCISTLIKTSGEVFGWKVRKTRMVYYP